MVTPVREKGQSSRPKEKDTWLSVKHPGLEVALSYLPEETSVSRTDDSLERNLSVTVG